LSGPRAGCHTVSTRRTPKAARLAGGGVALLALASGVGPPAAAHEAHPAPAAAPAPTPAAPGPGPGLADPALAGRPFLPCIKPARDFALADTGGRLVRLSDLAGRVRIVNFIFSTCPSACPLLTQRLALLQEALAAAGKRDAVAFLTVTVDPARDDRATLAAYADRFGADLGSWSFLTGRPEEVGPVLAAWDEWTRRLPSGELDHPARLYLVDRGGTVREIYSLSFFDERQALLDVEALLAEPAS
jgi:protein SCO1